MQWTVHKWCGLDTRKNLSNENKYTKTTPIEDAKSQLFFSFFLLPKQSSRSLKAIPAAAASFEMVTLRANKFGFEKTSNGTKVNGGLKWFLKLNYHLWNMNLYFRIFLSIFYYDCDHKDCSEKKPDNFHTNVLYNKMFDILQDLLRDFTSTYLC